MDVESLLKATTSPWKQFTRSLWSLPPSVCRGCCCDCKSMIWTSVSNLADTLSRAYLKNASNSSEPAAEVLVIEKELEQIHMADFLPISQPRIEEIQRETESDGAMQILKSTILQGWPSTKSAAPPETSPYYQIRDELTVQNGIIFRGERCVIPRPLRADTIVRIHRLHIGMEGCLRRARESIYWPGMTSAIKDYISQCETCRAYETNQ